MTRAFDEDSRKHLGAANGGPPGYDDEFLRRWLFGQSVTEGWKVLADGVAAGGMIVWILPDGDNFLGTIFVDPDFQNRGMGGAAWKFIEEKYPQTKSWRLTTPKEALKNNFFHRTKCGFHRVDSDRIVREAEGPYIYMKKMMPSG
jgi:GNAT superfamily N-acetyltransferase